MKSSLDDIPLPDIRQGLAHALLDRFQTYGNRTAMIDGTSGLRVTYTELHDNVDRLAVALCARGLRRGHLLLLASVNCVEFPVIFLAVTYLGGIISTVNPHAAPEELRRQICDCRPQYIVAGSVEVYDNVVAALDTLLNHKVTDIFTIQPKSSSTVTVCIQDLLLDATPVSRCQHHHVIADPQQQVAALPYSSGTTGLPKGVLLTHHNILTNLHQFSHPSLQTTAAGSRQDIVMGILPFYHIFGLCIVQLYTLFRGSVLLVMPKFQLQTFLKAVQDYKVTYIPLVPPIAIQLARSPVVARYDLSSVTSLFCGAAPLSQEIIHEIRSRLNIQDIRQGFGMTEMIAALHCPLGHTKPESIGLLLPHTEAKIVDAESKEEVTVNQKGELWLRGPQVMTGYHSNPTATHNSLSQDGWLKTGDLAYYDNDGFFFIVDRLKEIFKYKGFQVSPAELEALILRHPAVADVAVVGVPDTVCGHLPKAFVVRKSIATCSDTDIIDFVKGHSAAHNYLRGGVQFISAVPRSPSGKIQRRKLQEQESNNLTKSKL